MRQPDENRDSAESGITPEQLRGEMQNLFGKLDAIQQSLMRNLAARSLYFMHSVKEKAEGGDETARRMYLELHASYLEAREEIGIYPESVN